MYRLDDRYTGAYHNSLIFCMFVNIPHTNFFKNASDKKIKELKKMNANMTKC